jgi:hypothetical protein
MMPKLEHGADRKGQDADLARVIAAWPALSETVRKIILAAVEAGADNTGEIMETKPARPRLLSQFEFQTFRG